MRFVRDFFEIFGDLEMREAVAPETTIYIHTARPPTSFAIRCCLGVAQNCMWFRLGPSTSSSHALCLVPSLPRLNLAATEGKVLGRENDCEAFVRVSVRLSVYMCVRARATCAHVYVT